MFIRILLIVSLAFFTMPASAVFAEKLEKTKPMAQVYEVGGEAVVKKCADGKSVEVKKGLLLGREDILTLEKNTLVGLYFKEGGKTKVRSEKLSLTCKVGDLLPKKEAYEKAAPAFGATRGVYRPESGEGIDVQSFFYPQKTIILNSPPLIELTIFDGAGIGLRILRATIRVLENGAVLYSKELANLKQAVAYSYSCENLAGGKEYSAEVQLEIAEIPDKTISFVFDFYIVDSAGKESISEYEPFGDSVCKSLEYTSTDYGMKKYEFWFLKNLEFKEGKIQPIVSIETLVK